MLDFNPDCFQFRQPFPELTVPKKVVTLVFNPFFWMYFSWTWLFLALVYGSVSRGLRHLLHQANAFEQLVRKRLYRDYYARTHDPKWDVDTPLWSKVLFGVGVMVGHWLATFEGPELHRLPGGWVNVGIWGLIVVTMLIMQYDSTLYLARYSDDGLCIRYMLLRFFFPRRTATLCCFL
ncbi:hypothetical protein F2Q68_00000821 [Brassica cretica]|uniref:Uncharacterized protein n=1 Tax=Brassica cretica TaxID=69181 RepID=A0A8S9JAY9_BRACR|nr:hypothetical protein F2Q68_00000821 [Brassica cretica]